MVARHPVLRSDDAGAATEHTGLALIHKRKHYNALRRAASSQKSQVIDLRHLRRRRSATFRVSCASV